MGVYQRKVRGERQKTFTAEFIHRNVRVNQNTGCETKREALMWILARKTQIEEDYKAGRLTKKVRSSGGSSVRDRLPDDVQLAEAFDRYVQEHLSSKDSFRGDKHVVRRLVDFFHPVTRRDANGAPSEWRPFELRELRTAEVKQYASSRGKQAVGAATVTRDVAVLRAMHNYCVDVLELELPRIAWGRTMPRPEPKERAQYTVEQARRLVDCAEPDLADVILFAALTGFRRHEIEKAVWPDVRFDVGRITVKGKGRKTATVPLAAPVLDMLKRRATVGDVLNGGRIFDMKNFRRRWAATRAKAGLSDFVFHELRHTTASWLADGGVDPFTIQEIMRHSDVKTTMGYVHSHKTKARGQEAVDQIGEIAFGLDRKPGKTAS